VTELEFTATVARGLEPLVQGELQQLGASEVAVQRGLVTFSGPLELGYRACLWSRVASRLLLGLGRFESGDAEQLYAGVRGIDWRQHLESSGTLAVDCVTASGVSGHTRFLAQKTKDAICDALREATGQRPNVDREAPDVRVRVHVGAEETSVSLDLGGHGLQRRGYRSAAGSAGLEAPLKENLAAAVLLLAGWPERSAQGAPLVDPLCGSATLLIEAALIAADVAPGLRRHHHGMVGWRGHDSKLWDGLMAEAEQRAAAGRSKLPPLLGFDQSEQALGAARKGASAVGFGKHIELRKAALSAARPPAGCGPGLVVTNPPYGERLGSEGELVPLYETLGQVLREHFGGYRAHVLTGSPALAKLMGLKPEARIPLWNGPIECRLLSLPIHAREAGAERPAAAIPPEARPFENRLRKNARHFGRIARRRQLGSYRVYDADIGEFNLAVDVYETPAGRRAVVQEYAAPRSVKPETAMRRLALALKVVGEVLELPREAVVVKVRRRQLQGKQYERRPESEALFEVREGEHRFWVNLGSHLDSGLFGEQRLLRARAGELCAGRPVLNLFAYTCSAGLYCAKAGSATTNVDLSGPYLRWGRRNYELNGIDTKNHSFVQADCLDFLERERGRYGLVYLNPPSYSRSHRMESDFELGRDQKRLVQRAMALLTKDGVLLFSTHARGFVLDEALGRQFAVEALTARVLPEDFRRSPFQAFALRRR